MPNLTAKSDIRGAEKGRENECMILYKMITSTAMAMVLAS